MSTRVKKIFLSPFMFWIVVTILMKYFLFSFDMSVFTKPDPEGVSTSFVQKLFKAISIPRMNLGVDLQGGANLVVSVDVETAIDNRLVSESKNIKQLISKQDDGVLPVKQEISEQVLTMSFEKPEAASAAYSMIKQEVPHLKVSRKDAVLTLSLPPQEEQAIRVQSVDQAIDILRRRLDTAGVQGLVVQQHGDRQIGIQLPGEANIDEKKELIAKTAHLEFKIVQKTASTKEALLDEYDGELPSDKEIVRGRGKHAMYHLVSTFADLTGEHITFAKQDFDEYGKVEVKFTLDSVGTKIFADLTEHNSGKLLGIIIDDVMFSSPRIGDPIRQGSGRITGGFTSEQGRALSIVLNSGALKAPLKFEYETRVGASLGRDSIRKGVLSCLVGLGLLFIFGLFYYRLAGLFAFMALLFNLFLVLFFLSWFRFALTLPGIAGLVLTIGMSIDAAILIYERIREELATGASARKAINDGFSGAMVVIFDSNLTTFLTGVILFKFGSPAIRGFAVTLMAGIAANIIASLFFLKSLFLFVLDNTKLRRFGI